MDVQTTFLNDEDLERKKIYMEHLDDFSIVESNNKMIKST